MLDKNTWNRITAERNYYYYLIEIVTWRHALLVLDINTWNHITVYKLLKLNRNIWNHTTVCKLFVLDKNTWNYITEYKQTIVDKWKSAMESNNTNVSSYSCKIITFVSKYDTKLYPVVRLLFRISRGYEVTSLFSLLPGSLLPGVE